MSSLITLAPFFRKYRWRLFSGILFIIISNYFAVLSPQLTGYVIDRVQFILSGSSATMTKTYQDPLVTYLISQINAVSISFSSVVIACGIVLLVLALLRGFFMFLMRQTIVVMSRLIEYDQKNQVFDHYQQI